MAAEGRWMVVLLLAVGCDADPTPMGDATEGSPSTTQSESSGSDSSSSSGDVLGCEGFAMDESGCNQAADCMWVVDFSSDLEAGCGVSAALFGACVGRGEPLTGRTTFYREVEGEPHYLVHDPSCFELQGTPIGWNECTGAPGEPEPCSCLCAGDECPWEEEALFLDACGVDQPCGENIQHALNTELGDSVQCVMEALRDRTLGAYDLHVEGSWWGEFTRIYASGDDEVQVLFRRETDQCPHPLSWTWEPSQRCTLQPPEFFAACLAASGAALDECLLAEAWFSDCEPVEPSCP